MVPDQIHRTAVELHRPHFPTSRATWSPLVSGLPPETLVQCTIFCARHPQLFGAWAKKMKDIVLCVLPLTLTPTLVDDLLVRVRSVLSAGGLKVEL